MIAQPSKVKTAKKHALPLENEGAFAADTNSDAIHRLIRQLVEHVGQNSQNAFANTESQDHQEIILDIALDGIRCVLLRTPETVPVTSASLSPREQEIARMVAKGYPNKTIAAVLEISSWTVCTHLRRMFAKLGVGSRAAMVAKLLEDGLLMGTAATFTQSGAKHTI